MTFFKYVRPERIDVVENCEIRFTPPGALNDPFELRPQFASLVAQLDSFPNLAETPNSLTPVLQQAYALLSEEQRSRLPFDEAAKSIGALMASRETRSTVAAMARQLLHSMGNNAEPFREEMYSALDRSIGILSLSEVPDDELMWAHYASRHAGLVIGFDETHAFFNRPRTANEEFGFLRRVSYADGAPTAHAGVLDDWLFLTKGRKWAYEREWRMLLPLSDAARVHSVEGDTIHLFAFPPDALTCIVLGAHATATLATSVRTMVDAHPALAHIQLARAELDLHGRSIRVSRPWPKGA